MKGLFKNHRKAVFTCVLVLVLAFIFVFVYSTQGRVSQIAAKTDEGKPIQQPVVAVQEESKKDPPVVETEEEVDLSTTQAVVDKDQKQVAANTAKNESSTGTTSEIKKDVKPQETKKDVKPQQTNNQQSSSTQQSTQPPQQQQQQTPAQPPAKEEVKPAVTLHLDANINYLDKVHAKMLDNTIFVPGYNNKILDYTAIKDSMGKNNVISIGRFDSMDYQITVSNHGQPIIYTTEMIDVVIKMGEEFLGGYAEKLRPIIMGNGGTLKIDGITIIISKGIYGFTLIIKG